jgi:FkbM family methyltransferase
MRILFVLKGLVLIRNFDEVIARLADAGHDILLAPTRFGDEELLPKTLATHARCQVVSGSPKRDEAMQAVAILRHARDYLRYQEPALADATANRSRALTNLARVVSHGTREVPTDLPETLLPLNTHEVRRLRETFDALEALVPPDPVFEQFIEAQRPDVMLVTPLVSFGGLQSDYIKAARRLGIPSACPVFSWDNLTNKGVMHERPDRTFVWNELQRQEAIRLHGVAPDAVVATGAPRFDPFFRWTASVTRDAFCASLGLDPGRRLVAYLGSSPLVSPDEPAFTDRWVDAVRASTDPALRDAQIVIRPHPAHKAVWGRHPRLAGDARPDRRHPGVATTHPKSAFGDHGLFDTLFHADAVVGLNTTAELEAGIVGTPVYTIRAPEVAVGQTGSQHFHYLLREHGGFVEDADTLEQHLHQLADGLAGRYDGDRIRGFIETFLRPRGIDSPTAPILAAEIEQWAAEATTRRSSVGRDAPPVAIAVPSAERHQTADTLTAARDQRGADTPGQPTKNQVVYDRRPLFIYTSTRAERNWRLDPGHKEPWTVAWLDDNVRPGDVVYDIGANVGVFSLIAAGNLEDLGTVVAFEPGYANYSRLCENIRLNQFNRLIIPVPLPLADQSGLHRFRYKSIEPGQSRHHFAAETWDPTKRKKFKSSEQPVLALSLDQAVQDLGLPSPTLLKLDVDGAEALVLRGASAVLRRETVRSVIAEIDPEVESDVLKSFDQAGMTLVDRFKRKKKSGAWYGVFNR